MKRFLILAILSFCLHIPVQAQINLIILDMPANDIGLYDKFEVVIDTRADFANPYDPDDIRLDATFVAPSGREMTVAGFYYRHFDYSLVEQSLGWLEEWDWRVRFTPTEIGEWQFSLRLEAQSGVEESAIHSFNVVSSENHGFVRIIAENSRYLAFDDGTFYMPIGENMAWYGEERMADYQQWLDSLSEAGGNYIRVWMNEWGFGIETLDTGLGTYGGRQDRMFELDLLIEMLAEQDMTMMLTLLDHTAFSLVPDSRWSFNPYNIENGGMLRHPTEFIGHPEAQRLWRQRLRYILARWGYAPQIMAWEWWNEVHLTPLHHPRILAPWLEQSSAYLDTLDPYQHLVTISGVFPITAQIWNLPSLDFTQDHVYYLEDWSAGLARNIQIWRFRYDKPVLLAEYGYAELPEYDPLAIRFHLGLWAAPMNGALGTGMFWWWDLYIHPNDFYPHIRGIANFFDGEDLASKNYQLTNGHVTNSARLYGLQDESHALLWVVSPHYDDRNYDTFDNDTVPDTTIFPEICDAEIELQNLEAGSYQIEFWDTIQGIVVQEEMLSTINGDLEIQVPCFRTDYALKVQHIGN